MLVDSNRGGQKHEHHHPNRAVPIPANPQIEDTREFFEYRKAIEAYILDLEHANESLRLQVLGR